MFTHALRKVAPTIPILFWYLLLWHVTRMEMYIHGRIFTWSEIRRHVAVKNLSFPGLQSLWSLPHWVYSIPSLEILLRQRLFPQRHPFSYPPVPARFLMTIAQNNFRKRENKQRCVPCSILSFMNSYRIIQLYLRQISRGIRKFTFIFMHSMQQMLTGEEPMNHQGGR